MKKLLILLLAFGAMGAVGPFSDTGLTIGLSSRETASKNTGTLVVVRGPSAPDTWQ